MWAVPTIYYDYNLSGLVATSELTGFEASKLLDRLESTWWKATSAADQYITFDAGFGKTIGCDFVGVSGHNLAGTDFMLQYSNDNFSSDINDVWDRNISEFATSVFDASATSPRGISFSSDGTLWICDATTNKIYNIKKDGTRISEFATSVFDASATNPSDISYASNGTLWITDLSTLKIYNIETDGTWISEFATSVFDASATFPTGISYISDTLWICDATTDKIYNIQTDGTWISEFATSVFDASATSPQSLSFSSDDTLWICDATTNKIYNIETDGTWISEFATSEYDASATFPSGISFSSNGTLWVCDATTDKIYNVIISLAVNNNSFLKEFNLIYSRYWRIKLTNLSVAPYMAMAYWGKKTELDYLTAAFDPHAEEEEANLNESESGVLLGDHIKHIKKEIPVTISDANDALYQKVKGWKDGAGLRNAIFAWNKTDYSSDIWVMRRKVGSFKAPFTKRGVYRNISFTLIGVKE